MADTQPHQTAASRVVGARVGMVDAGPRVRGTIPYTLNLEAPRMAVGRLVRSTQPHARLTHVDVGAAADMPGVLAVLTGSDLAGDSRVSPYFGPLTRDQPILASERVRYVGEPIVAIAATDADSAARAAEAVTIEYEPLPAYLSLDDAAPVTAEYAIVHGDAATALAAADIVIEGEYSTPLVQHVALEPHVVLAHFEPGGRFVVHSATQTPHHLRRQLAEILQVPQSDVRVIVNTLGGAFGGKCYPEIEPIAVLLARQARRPVKIVLDRAEEFVTTARQATRTRIVSGAMRDGRVVAVKAECLFANGPYAETADRVVRNGVRALTAPYAIGDLDLRATARYTNSVPCGPFRAPGAAQTIWAMESHLDELASALGLSPLTLRRRNLVGSGQSYVDGGLLEHIRYPEMLDGAEALLSTASPIGAPHLSPGERRGVGFAVAMKTTNTPSTSTATVKMNADGSLDVLSSSVEMGQGATTVLAQIAATRAAVPLDQVRLVSPDTDFTPFDHSTTSSRTTFAMGTAVERAVDEVTSQLRELAAEQFEVGAHDIRVVNGQATIAGSDARSLTYAQIIERSRRGNVIGRGTFVTAAQPDPVTGEPGASAHYHQAVGGAEVAIDVDTGRVRVLRLHVGVFVGQAINPTLCELQAEGSLAMGLGQALFEEMIIDGGQVTNANLGDYLIPALPDLPPTMHTSLYEQAAHPDIHGLGEIAVPLAPPAIANAIADAIGVRIRDLPLTPERVLRALRDHQAHAQSLPRL